MKVPPLWQQGGETSLLSDLKLRLLPKVKTVMKSKEVAFLTEFIVLLQKKAPLPGLDICNEKRERCTCSLVHFPTS